jgi:hypothetical protein
MPPLHYFDDLEARTSFYVGEKARAVIDGMKQRDRERRPSKDPSFRRSTMKAQVADSLKSRRHENTLVHRTANVVL